MTPRERERNRRFVAKRLDAIEAEINLLRLDGLPVTPDPALEAPVHFYTISLLDEVGRVRRELLRIT